MFRPTLTEGDIARSTILSGFRVKKKKTKKKPCRLAISSLILSMRSARRSFHNIKMTSLLRHPETILFFPEASHGFNGVILLDVILN